MEAEAEPVLPPSMARRLAETNQVGRRTPLPGTGIDPEVIRGRTEAAEDSNLKATNAQLRATLDEVHQILEEAQVQEQAHLERAQKLQEIIVEHEATIQALEEHVSKLELELENRPILKNADELKEWEDELERESTRLSKERKRFENERKQMEEDEADLEKQMRDMEVSMARERAMMARQETELKRLSAEIAQVIEQSAKGNSVLREQMLQFQRRHQEVLARGAGLTVPAPAAPAAAQVVPAPMVPSSSEDDKKDGSLFKRIFGK
jgi:chromosome segregation ATPase